MSQLLRPMLTVLAMLAACKTPSPGNDSTVASLETECGATSESAPKFSQTSTPPVVISDLPPSSKSKRAALIYYAVDSPEPFMTISVDHEIKSLRQACKAAAVDWVAVTNSFFMKRAVPSVAVCRQGKYSLDPVDPKFVTLFNLKRQILLDRAKAKPEFMKWKFPGGVPEGNTDEESLALFNAEKEFASLPNFKPPFDAKRTKDFMDYPLSHPEFVHDVLSYVRDRIFEPTKYTYFVHLKSHGSHSLFLTGLTEEQAKGKADCQSGIIAKVKAEKISETLSKAAGLGEIGLGEAPGLLGEAPGGLGEAPGGLGEAPGGLGEAPGGLGEAPGGLGEAPGGLGEIGLGEVGLGAPGGLGAAGLGVNGLGALNHFGLGNTQMIQVLKTFLGNQSRLEDGIPITSKDTEIAFLMFESCDSNNRKKQDVWREAFDKHTPGLRAYYSAAGSLWYRNLDWDKILKQWKTDTAGRPDELRTLLIDWTTKIPNYVTETE